MGKLLPRRQPKKPQLKKLLRKPLPRKLPEEAIRNSVDPIQQLFLDSIHSAAAGKIDLGAEFDEDLKQELARVANQFGIRDGKDVTAFPDIKFEEPTLDPINVSN